MNTTTVAHRSTRGRSVVVIAAVAGLCLATSAPVAVAAPQPQPAATSATRCTPDMDGLAHELRDAGMTAQAADVATQLTYRDCREAQMSSVKTEAGRHADQSRSRCAAVRAAISNLASQTRNAGGRVYRGCGTYSAGAALRSLLLAWHCVG